jgi:hypothetical protein
VTISSGANVRLKTTTPERSGGTNVAIACPNMWLSGSRFRNLIGRNGLAYFLYFPISRSIGTTLARMFRCVRTTPLGSDVAPDVKITSAISSGACETGGGDGWAASEVSVDSFQIGASTPVGSGTASPTSRARASTIRATRCRKSAEAR